MQRTQRSFYKENKRRRERFVLLKRTQKNARTLSSFEKNGCPTLQETLDRRGRHKPCQAHGWSIGRHGSSCLPSQVHRAAGPQPRPSIKQQQSCRRQLAGTRMWLLNFSSWTTRPTTQGPRTAAWFLPRGTRRASTTWWGIWWKLQRKCFSTLWKRTKLETILTRWSVAQAGSNDEKNWGQKSRWTVPFRECWLLL